MKIGKYNQAKAICFLIIVYLFHTKVLIAQKYKGQLPASLNSQIFHDSITAFIGQEYWASLKAMGSFAKRPTTLFGETYEGDFSWSGFAEGLALYRQSTNRDTISKAELLPWIHDLINEEARIDGSTFAQIFSCRSLLAYQIPGKPISENPLFKTFSPEEQAKVRGLLDVKRSYDPEKMEARNGRPANYLAVCLLVAAYSYQLGTETDKALISKLQDKCIELIVESGGYIDDDKGKRGRYDRYGFEFLRFVWEAAQITGNKEALKKLQPYEIKAAKLWWDMLSPTEGHSSPYGRSLQNSWDDTWEMVGFYAENPVLRPAPLPQLAAAFALSWNDYIKNQYNLANHSMRMLEFGRGTYSYVGRNRIWSYTTHSFAKTLKAEIALVTALRKEKVKEFKAVPELADVSRFEFIRNGAGRKMGIWAYRTKEMYFVLPVVGSFKNAACNDYLAIPYGLKGLQVPVTLQTPALVSHFTMPDGKVIVPAEGADSIALLNNGSKLRLVYETFTTLTGEFTNPGLKCVITWEAEKNVITQEQILTATKESVSINKWRYSLPTSYPIANADDGSVETEAGDKLLIHFETDFKESFRIGATGNTVLSKGAFYPVPLMLNWQAENINIGPGEVIKSKMVLGSQKK